MAFYVGQKVVCVDDDFGNTYSSFFYKELPKKDGIYTVSGFHEKGTGIYLAEIDSIGTFWCSRFRPIVSRPTSISIFTAMLGPTKVREDA